MGGHRYAPHRKIPRYGKTTDSSPPTEGRTPRSCASNGYPTDRKRPTS